MTARFAAVAAAALVAGVAAAGDPSPTDDAARRAEFAKLRRLAWSDATGPVSFCDLDGSNVVVSDLRRADWLRWLPDGRRVAAVGGDRAYVVDSRTGKSVDLTGDAKPGVRFTGVEPAISTDRRRLALWRCTPPRAPGESLIVDSYALFDLETGARTEIPAPVRVELRHDLRPAWSPRPTAWWTADGSALYAVVGSPCQSLARCAPDGSRPTTVASVGNSRKIVEAAVDGPFVVFAVEDDRRFEVRDVAGKPLFVLDESVRCTRLAWESDGAAFVVDVARKAAVESWRVEPGKPATKVVADAARTYEFGPGHDPRPLGGGVLFWRVASAGREDLWFFDPTTRSELRLTDRGFAPRSWDVLATPPASRGR